jgi:hypothetical protein
VYHPLLTHNWECPQKHKIHNIDPRTIGLLNITTTMDHVTDVNMFTTIHLSLSQREGIESSDLKEWEEQ